MKMTSLSGITVHCAWCAAGLVLLTATARGAEGEGKASLADIPALKPIPQPAPELLDKAIARGVAFLMQVQNKDGSWGSHYGTKGLNIYAPGAASHLAFRSAVTALCLAALIETGGDSDQVRVAIECGEAWLLERLPTLRRATPIAIYSIWSHAYSIQALVRMHGRRPDDHDRQRQIAELIRGQMEFLRRYESVDGGWGYLDFRAHAQRPTTSSISFVNATVLVALSEARQLGITPPEDVVHRAIAATVRQRKPDFTYLYGEYLKARPMRGIHRPGGSLGRSQACNLALRLWGDSAITDAVLEIWLKRLIARNGWLSIGRKRPIPHEAWFQVAGYFYYYGHYYAALCMEQLPLQQRSYYQDHLANILLPLQEKDGSWWDYPLYDYHQQYGTAFALMILNRCRRTR